MLSAALGAAFIATPSMAFDVLRTAGNISWTPGGRIVPSSASCEFASLGSPLQLQEVIERALCDNTKTRVAWANVKVQAAAVGIARAAFLPTITGDWQGGKDDSVTNITNHPELSSATRATIRSESVSLNWMLFDFGARSAALKNATALLAAARATQDATLQAVFMQVSRDFYAAQAAAGALSTANDVERMANESQQAAQIRVDKGIAPITDALAAQTEYEQAAVALAKARGELQTALGALASDMGLSPCQQSILACNRMGRLLNPSTI
jgi:outer membrane protein